MESRLVFSGGCSRHVDVSLQPIRLWRPNRFYLRRFRSTLLSCACTNHFTFVSYLIFCLGPEDWEKGHGPLFRSGFAAAMWFVSYLMSTKERNDCCVARLVCRMFGTGCPRSVAIRVVKGCTVFSSCRWNLSVDVLHAFLVDWLAFGSNPRYGVCYWVVKKSYANTPTFLFCAGNTAHETAAIGHTEFWVMDSYGIIRAQSRYRMSSPCVWPGTQPAKHQTPTMQSSP